jgi:hypothetical protein
MHSDLARPRHLTPTDQAHSGDGVSGARNGRVATTAVRPPVRPATRGMRVVSRASARLIAGNMVVNRRASLDVPAPGGRGGPSPVRRHEWGWYAAASTWESGHPKPDPKVLDSIFTAIPAPKEHAVYVGDWYPDVETARGGGVRFIAVLSDGIPRHAFRREGIPEDHILARLHDLLRLVQML